MSQTVKFRGICLSVLLALAGSIIAVPAHSQTSTPPVASGEPAFETFGALPWDEPPGAVPFLVESVIDGDTFSVIDPDNAEVTDPWWEPVRMIGVDSPEKEGPYTDEECYGQEASAFLTGLLPQGTTVYLQVDNAEEIPDSEELTDVGMELDDNGRWLVHVYLKADGTDEYYLVTEILALGGFVDVKDYNDNTYFVDELQEAEDIARHEDRGLWGACDT